MNADRVTKWIKEVRGWLDPPGCETVEIKSLAGERSCCTIGLVHEHRFAFFYWALYSQNMTYERPILLTLDSHNDIGVPGDVALDDLRDLNIADRTQLGLFAWLRLRQLNDGHVLPAVYLNFFSDVYALLSMDDDSWEFDGPFSVEDYRDLAGNSHAVAYCRDHEQLLQHLPTDVPVFLDIDLDYFAVDSLGKLVGSEVLKPDEEVRSVLSLKGPLMRTILDRIVGITIALEPSYCGGLVNSLHVLDILNNEFFGGALCTHDCKWRGR